MPAVVFVLAACLGGLGLATTHLRCQDAAADAARLLSRGEPVAVAQRHVQSLVSDASLTIGHPSGLVCATVHVEHRVLLVPIALSATSCALSGGW